MFIINIIYFNFIKKNVITLNQIEFFFLFFLILNKSISKGLDRCFILVCIIIRIRQLNEIKNYIFIIIVLIKSKEKYLCYNSRLG